LISPDKIDEWIQEVEERPASAALIIRYIANRLSELAQREEELAAENIELLNGRRVGEYESRIASLEYQLELLKRQLGGEVILPEEAPEITQIHETVSLLVYNPSGSVLRLEVEPSEIDHGKLLARLEGEVSQAGLSPSVLGTTSHEELMFLFDSGRTVTHAANQLPVASREEMNWEQAFIEEPRIKEELASIQPIASMPLYDLCIQSSRRGYVKKIRMASFTTHLAEAYIGTGVKLPADKTFGVTFAQPDSLFVMVSQEGFIFSMPADRLPSAIEEVIRLGISDHIVSAFIASKQPSLLFITQNGKAVHRETSWLEPANSFKSRGQSLLSKERRETGVHIAGAAPVDDGSWGIFLNSDGTLRAYSLHQLLAAGRMDSGQPPQEILGFSAFTLPETNR
jgi:DNA gyrase/topoisomerase IV subunit A